MAGSKPTCRKPLTRFEITRVTAAEVAKIQKPSILIYQQVLGKDADREILHSNIKTRLDLDLPASRLHPVPFYYCESKVLLGWSCQSDCGKYLCTHAKIPPDYYDIYPAREYRELLHHGEADLLQKKKTLLPERVKLREAPHAVKKILLGTTLVPQPVAQYLSEKEPQVFDSINMFALAWSQPPCPDCTEFHRELKKRRTVERLLFLRFTGSHNSGKLDPNQATGTISKLWANQWVEYLFFDTDIFSRRAISKNFQFPQPPGEIPNRLEPGETVMSVSGEMMHVVRSFYQAGYLSKPTLPKKDEALLNTVKAGQLSAKIHARLEKIASFLIKKLIVESQWSTFTNEWLEFDLSPKDAEDKLPLSDPRSPKYQSPSSFKLQVMKADSAMSAHKFGSRPDTFSGPEPFLQKATLGDIVFPSPQGRQSQSSSASFRFGVSQPVDLQPVPHAGPQEWISEEDEPATQQKDELSIGEISDKNSEELAHEELSQHD